MVHYLCDAMNSRLLIDSLRDGSNWHLLVLYLYNGDDAPVARIS